MGVVEEPIAGGVGQDRVRHVACHRFGGSWLVTTVERVPERSSRISRMSRRSASCRGLRAQSSSTSTSTRASWPRKRP